MVKSKKNNNNVSNNDEAARLARWSTSAYSAANFSIMSPPPPENKKLLGFGSSKQYVMDVALQPIEHDDLKQGSLYIVKIRNVSVALFEGWDDDMCCFAVLRSDSTPMRWSEARYIPGDFDAYDAFDEAGNPPVHLWTRQLRVNVPTNWFSIFEEARRKQRDWMNEQNEDQDEYYYPPGEQPVFEGGRRQQVKHKNHHHNNNNTTTITPPASTGKSTEDKQTESQDDGETSEQAIEDKPEEDEEETASAAGSQQPMAESVKGDDVGAASTTSGTATPPTSAGASTPPIKQQPRTTVVKEYEPVSNPKYESTHVKQLATPPASPNASEQVKKYQASSEKSRILSTSDIAFAHNADQFSFAHEVSTPPVPPINPKNIKSGSNDTATPKSKRRSVQDLFRGNK